VKARKAGNARNEVRREINKKVGSREEKESKQ
jgi:hypothetical protein